MKKLLLWVLVLVISMLMVGTFSFVGCKKEPAPAEEVTEETEQIEEEAVEEVKEEVEEEPKEIVFATCLLEVYPGWNQAHAAFLEACDKYGYIGTVAGPNEINIEKQIEVMETAIGNNVDAMISVPLTPESFIPVYEEAKEAGILIAESAVTSDSDLENVITWCGTDMDGLGRTAAQKIAEKGEGSANVLVVYTGPEAANQEAEIDAFLAETGENYPDVVITERIFDKSDLGIAVEGIKNAITAYPEIDFIWCVEGFAPTAVVVALDEMSKTEEINTLAIDMAIETYDSIKEGKLWATLNQNFDGWGGGPVEQLHNYWTEQPVERYVDTGSIFYDIDNIDTYVPFED